MFDLKRPVKPYKLNIEKERAIKRKKKKREWYRKKKREQKRETIRYEDFLIEIAELRESMNSVSFVIFSILVVFLVLLWINFSLVLSYDES